MGWGKRLDLCELENAPEMQKCPRTFVHDYRFKVGDKVIRRDYKKKQAIVSWKGYSDDFNSWIPLKDLQGLSN